jgi:hypothetical protein
MEDEDVNVDLVPLEVLLDLWRVRWGRQYVAIPTDTFWSNVGERLFDANWMTVVRGNPERHLYQLRDVAKL